MVTIKRFLDDGSNDIVTASSVRAFRRSPKGKARAMKAFAIIDAISGAVLSIIRIVKEIKG